jgi:hypothetical protein
MLRELLRGRRKQAVPTAVIGWGGHIRAARRGDKKTSQEELLGSDPEGLASVGSEWSFSK